MKERPGKYVRDHYGVPAFINRRVRFTGLPHPVTGKITGFRGATLIVKFDADPGTGRSRHRGNRCWTDCMGEPLFRTRSLIACHCDGLVAS